MKKNGSLQAWLILIAIIFLPAMFLWIPYSQRMWQSGHYQYFPIVFLAVGFLLWQRRHRIAEHRTEASGWLLGIGVFAILLATVSSNLLVSPLLGIITSLLGTLLLVYGMFGWGGFKQAFPILLLLVFTVPLPLNLDRKMVFEMQFLASQFSSWLLDGIGVVHFRNGVVLMTEKSQYLTEEACSGVRSLFSTMAIVAIVSVSLRHKFWRFLLNVIQSLFWVIVGNAIRVCAVVYIADNYTNAVAKGTGHEIVGMVVFAFILLMVYSTDSLIGLIRQRYISPLGMMQDAEEDETNKSPVVFNGVKLSRVTIAFLLLFATAATLISARVGYVYYSRSNMRDLVELPRLAEPDQTDLPEQIQEWKLASFNHVKRETSFLQAEDSHIWTYRKGSMVAHVSLDGPWAEWHNLAFCYRGLGWQTKPEYFIPIVGDYQLIRTKDLRHSEIDMQREGERGFVIFSSVDRNGQELLPEWRMGTALPDSLPKAVMRQAAAALGFSLDTQFAIVGNRLPATTIQLAVTSSSELTDEDVADAKLLFYEARERLVVSRRFQQPEQPEQPALN